MTVLPFFLGYLSFRKQGTTVDSAYSALSNTRRGIPQGSILGPLLFNIFNDILIIIDTRICTFAVGNTSHSCGEILTKIKENLVFDKRDILN